MSCMIILPFSPSLLPSSSLLPPPHPLALPPELPYSLLCDSSTYSMSHKKSSGRSPSLQTRADTGRASPSSSLTSSRNTNSSSSSKDNSPKDTSRSTLGTPPKGNSPKELHRNTSGGSLPGQQPAYSRSDSQTSTTSTSSVQTLRANSSSGSLQNAPVRTNSASGRVPCIPVSVNRPEIELMSPISPTGTSLKAARPPVVGPEAVSGCGQHCLTDLLSSVKNC